MKTIYDLAKFKVGESPYWIVLRPIKSLVEHDESASFLLEHHPKDYYTKGEGRSLWHYNNNLPKLSSEDFNIVVSMLRSHFSIEKFVICDINRSNNSGEFYYINEEAENMPESNLFKNMSDAVKEVKRIKKMMAGWASK
mgnify:CR=1 FL=1